MKGINAAILFIFFLCASASALGDPATVIDDFGCGGFVPGYEVGDPPLAFLDTTESHSVITGDDGKTILVCHFDHDVELERATGARGFICGTFLGLTDDTKMFAAPGGRAVLVCKI